MAGPLDLSPSDHANPWAASGAMALTGRPGGPPLGPPSRLVPQLRALGQRLCRATADGGTAVPVDALALLGERAALMGLGRGGATSCGGASRLLRAADGWVAVSLARPEDWASVAAWLDVDVLGGDWDGVSAAIAARSVATVVDQAVLLGLPVAALPEEPPPPIEAPEPFAGLPVRAAEVDDRPRPRRIDECLVVDLTGLWAGPLCGALLADAGARVVKVESASRPDGGRRGPVPVFDLLNAGKESVALDLATGTGRTHLAALVGRADVVLEAARPRALEQLGVWRDRVMATAGPQVWLSLTGHGRTGPARERVGFGDDAAVAGGLVVWDEVGPCFCADAVADPAAGLTAAVAVTEALAAGGRWTIDVALAEVAAALAGPTQPVASDIPVAAPRARAPRGAARALGADTEAVLAWSGRRA